MKLDSARPANPNGLLPLIERAGRSSLVERQGMIVMPELAAGTITVRADGAPRDCLPSGTERRRAAIGLNEQSMHFVQVASLAESVCQKFSRR